MSKRKGEPQTDPQRNEPSDAGRAQRRLERPDITDERLGLLPADTEERRSERVSGVFGADRDDVELSEPAGLDLAWRPRRSDTEDTPSDHLEGYEEAQVVADESDLTTTPHEFAEAPGVRPAVEPSWTSQPMFTDPVAAVGGPDDNADPVSDADETFIPPTDPVVTASPSGVPHVLGGFSPTGAEEVHPDRSSDGGIGDEAIADAVRAALRQDASTTDLQIQVTVARGVVRLRGAVADLDDADNAEAVAGRVEGVVDVEEQLRVSL